MPPSWVVDQVNFKMVLQKCHNAETTTYFAEVPDLVEPLQKTDVSTASSTTCLQLELLDRSLIYRSCVHTWLFAPVALRSHQAHAAEQHSILITLSHNETYCTRPKLTSRAWSVMHTHIKSPPPQVRSYKHRFIVIWQQNLDYTINIKFRNEEITITYNFIQ